MLGEWLLGAALFHLGDLQASDLRIEQALELYDPAFHQARVWETGIDPGIFCRCESARLQGLLGAPSRAVFTVQRAVSEARALGHPQTLAFSLLFAAIVHHERQEWQSTRDVLEESIALCQSKGIAQESLWAEPLAGRAMFELGDREAGLRRIEAGLVALAEKYSALLRPYYLHAYADVLLQCQRLEEAAAVLEEARASASLTSQHAYDAELHRLRGQLSVQRGDPVGAERHLRDAMAVASRQGASWLRLRAAAALARVLVAQERHGDAHDTLHEAIRAIDPDESAEEAAAARALAASLHAACTGPA
jgi:adenylate cyclase